MTNDIATYDNMTAEQRCEAINLLNKLTNLPVSAAFRDILLDELELAEES